jgi:hypothetical protein
MCSKCRSNSIRRVKEKPAPAAIAAKATSVDVH